MKKSIFLMLLAFFFVHGTMLCAQSQPKKKNSKTEKANAAKKKTKTKSTSDVETVDSGNEADNPFKYRGNTNNPNVIKVNLTDVIVGCVPVYYERVINKHFSIEGGFGLTFASSIKSGSLSGLREVANFARIEDYNTVSFQTGTMFKIGARYYTGRHADAPEGNYVALEFQQKNYDFTVINGATNTLLPGSLTQTDFIRFLFGSQLEGVSGIMFDPYIGLALRKTDYLGYIKNDASGAYTYGSSSSIKPALIIGTKICINF